MRDRLLAWFGLPAAAASLLLPPSLGAAVAAGAERAARAPIALVSLRAESTVRGPEIQLGEVSEIRGQDPILLERLRQVEIGRAPLPGLTRTLDLGYLKARLRLQRIDPETLVLDAPPAVSVTTASRQVLGADLVRAVRQHILDAREADAENLGIRVTSPPPDLTLPAGFLELKVKPRPATELAGSFSIPVEIWVEGMLIRSVNVAVRVSALFEIVVAARPIARGEMLTPAAIRKERREVGLAQETLRDPEAVEGWRALRAIAPGEPILATLLELPPLVRRGEMVQLTIEGRGLRAIARGEAREDGKAGQVIRVRNLASGRDVYGQVEAGGIVRVPF